MYREPRDSLENATTLVAALRFRHPITYIESLGPGSCSSPLHCPLAGLTLIGDSIGTVRLLSESGDVLVEVGAPLGISNAVKVARLLKFKKMQECAYDTLVVAYFENIGIYVIQLDHEHGGLSEWQRLFVPAAMLVDFRINRGRNVGQNFSVHSLVMLDTEGTVFYMSELKIDCATDDRRGAKGGNDASVWNLTRVGDGMHFIYSSLKFGSFMTNRDGTIWKIDRRTSKTSIICSHTGDGHIVQRSFDEVSGAIYMSTLFNTSLLIRSKIAKGTCKEMHRIQIGLDSRRCISMSSSAGLTLISDGHEDRLARLTLFNHSHHLVKKYPSVWDASHFISFSSQFGAVENLPLSLSERIRMFSSKNGDGCLTLRMNIWSRSSLEAQSSIAVLSSRENILLLYRPLFRSATGKNDTDASDTMHLILGIFKSIGLMVAAVFGLRFASSKTHATRPVLGQQKYSDTLSLHSRDHMERPAKQFYERYHMHRGREEDPSFMSQHGIDRAPDSPQTRILEDNLWID